MRDLIQDFIRDERGLAAEFALVVPLLLLFVLGTIDIGYYAYRINQAEKATQMGARFASVTDPIAAEIATDSYVNTTVAGTFVEQGDRIPPATFTITCTSAGTTCTCTGADCRRSAYTKAPATGTPALSPFDRLLQRMQQIYPAIEATNLVVEYSGSGLGYAGNPNGPDISPIITVKLDNMTHTPIAFSPFGASVDLPDFAYSITAEDASGTASN